MATPQPRPDLLPGRARGRIRVGRGEPAVKLLAMALLGLGLRAAFGQLGQVPLRHLLRGNLLGQAVPNLLDQFQSLADARIKSYVPILARRLSRDRLRQHARLMA